MNNHLVFSDYYFTILTLSGFLAFVLCNDFKKRFADPTAWQFNSLFALTHALYHGFYLIQQFTGYFSMINEATAFFTYAASSFSLGFALNIRNRAGDLPSTGKLALIPVLLVGLSFPFNERVFAILNALLIGLPAILISARAFYRHEVYKVRKTCCCHKLTGIGQTMLLLAILLVSLKLVAIQNLFSQMFLLITSLIWVSAMWFCMNESSMETSGTISRQHHRILRLFLPVSIAAAIVLSMMVSKAMVIHAMRSKVNHKAIDFSSLEMMMQSQFNPADFIAEKIAADPLIKQFQDRDASEINLHLDLFASCLPDAVIYILLPDGSTVFSSNRDARDSFVGKNFAFRNYFKNALSKGNGSQIARGTVSNVFGYYSSAVLKNSKQNICGVVVVKISLQSIANLFSEMAPTAIIDENGEIVSSNRPAKTWTDFIPFNHNRLFSVDQKNFGLAVGKEFKIDFSLMVDQQKILWLKPLANSEWFLCILDSSFFLAWPRLFGIILNAVIIFSLIIIAVVWRISLVSSDQVEKGAKIYQSLVEGSSNIVVLIDIYGNIITINSAGRNE
ncbi:MAG: hypothetical protein AB1403_21020, partial [Candidatus Riflebacteria bacterium]